MGAYDRVNFRGEPATRRQRAAILATEANIGQQFDILQGSWQASSDVSGSTHTKAGVVDIWLPGMGDNTPTRQVTRRLRDVGGQAAFLRGPPTAFGGYVWHWHVVDLDTTGMDANATWQAAQYKKGFDGLQAGVYDPVPWRPDPIRMFDFAAWVKAEQLAGDLSRVNDRIDNKLESLQQLRADRDRLRRQRARLLAH